MIKQNKFMMNQTLYTHTNTCEHIKTNPNWNQGSQCVRTSNSSRHTQVHSNHLVWADLFTSSKWHCTSHAKNSLYFSVRKQAKKFPSLSLLDNLLEARVAKADLAVMHCLHVFVWHRITGGSARLSIQFPLPLKSMCFPVLRTGWNTGRAIEEKSQRTMFS